MTNSEAKELLLHHSYTHPDSSNHPKSERGFLGMLRPFNGTLPEENYHEVMTVLLTLADEFDQSTVDKEMIAALWGICHYTRAWAISPDGMLRRNDLISEQQVHQLEDWVESISYAASCLLEGAGKAQAFEFYKPF